MKNLILFRHGKSSWEYDVNDQDRPLKLRGIKDGHLVANTFKSTSTLLPDMIYSSPANRALHTCNIFCRNLDFPLDKVQLNRALYDFSGESVIRFVKQLDDSLNTVAIFGHNYAFTNIANQWGSRHIDNVPTSGLVCLRFEQESWANTSKGSTELLLFPKDLR